MTDGNPVPYAPLSCPQCNGEWGMFEHLDFDRDTIGYGCRKCGITERDKHGAICRVMGVRIARPPGVSVEGLCTTNGHLSSIVGQARVFVVQTGR